MGAAALLDPPFAQVGGERGQVGQPQSGQGEHHAGDPQVAAAPVQPRLVDRAQAVQDDAGAQEQGGLDEAVPDDIDGRPGQPERGEPADPDQEHPGVADGREGQQALDVTLAEAEQGAHDRGQQPQGQEGVRNGVPVAQAVAEHRPVDPGDAVQPEFDHDAGEQYAERGRSHRVGVGQPEVERHDRALDQQPHQDEHEGHHDEAVGLVVGDVPADLGHVQSTGPPVDQTDTRQ